MMAGWEIALIIVAVTFLMVNTVQSIITMRMMVKMEGVLCKIVKLIEKFIVLSDKSLDELIDGLDNNKKKES